MRICPGSAGIGFIVGFGTTLLLFVAVTGYGGVPSVVCVKGETPISCLREWSDVGAMVAGAVTIVFLWSGQRQTAATTRESFALQTVEMRAVLANAIHCSRDIERQLDYLCKRAEKFRSDRYKDLRADQYKMVASPVIELLRTVNNPAIATLVRYDGQVGGFQGAAKLQCLLMVQTIMGEDVHETMVLNGTYGGRLELGWTMAFDGIILDTTVRHVRALIERVRAFERAVGDQTLADFFDKRSAAHSING